MRLKLVRVEADVRNWPAVNAAVALALFLAVVVVVSLDGPLVLVATFSSIGAALSGAAMIDAVWVGYGGHRE